jgi:hypothetical protein
MDERLKSILQRMDYFTVAALAERIEALGADAVSELRALAEQKHRRAIWDGRAYIRPDVALQMDAIVAITKGLNFSKRRTGKNGSRVRTTN